MIKIIENRRLWNVNHKVEAISDTEIKVTVDDKEEIFDLSSLEDGERYILEDSLVLPYNPISGITKENGVITVTTFYDDPHKRGFEANFKRESKKIIDAIPLSAVQQEEIKRISALSVERNYELLPQYKRDNIYAGETACEGYPYYLRGEAGKLTIAKMNKYFRDKTKEVQSQILKAKTKTEARTIGDPFPKTAEEMLEILNG